MKVKVMNLLQWLAFFALEAECVEALKQERWPNGFQCPQCSENQGHWVVSRKVYQCNNCRRQTSVTTSTLFNSTNLPLVQRTLAVHLMVCGKEGLSALCLSEQVGMFWITAHRLQPKMHHAKADRDNIYRLYDLAGLDDALQAAKLRRWTPIVVAIESRDKNAGFIAMETIPSVSAGNIRQLVQRHPLPWQTIRTDGLRVLRVLRETQHHEGRVTPPEQLYEWRPWVHIAISDFKTLLLGIYHGVISKYPQEHLDEFVNHFQPTLLGA